MGVGTAVARSRSACSRAGAGRTWAGQCGDPQTTGDPVHAAESPRLKGTSAPYFFSPVRRALQRPTAIPPPISYVELVPSPPKHT